MIVDRTEQRRKLLDRYQDPSRAPFPGAVAMKCDKCGSHVLWVSPPLPSDGRTVCGGCG